MPAPVKEARGKIMAAAAQAGRQAYYQSQLGKIYPVLFEQPVGGQAYEGHTPQYTPVRVKSSRPLSGKVLPVLLTEAGEEFCTGALAEGQGT